MSGTKQIEAFWKPRKSSETFPFDGEQLAVLERWRDWVDAQWIKSRNTGTVSRKMAARLRVESESLTRVINQKRRELYDL